MSEPDLDSVRRHVNTLIETSEATGTEPDWDALDREIAAVVQQYQTDADILRRIKRRRLKAILEDVGVALFALLILGLVLFGMGQDGVPW